MPGQFDISFYRGKSWGTQRIARAWDLPTLKLRYLLQTLARRPSPGLKLLDVGCGGGRLLRSIRAADADIALTGIDCSGEQLGIARAAHTDTGIVYVEGDGEALPFDDASFDVVTFFDYLEHIERPGASMREIARVAKPDGLLHFVCPAEAERFTPYALSQRIFGRHFKEETIGHIQTFTFAELESLVTAAGFRIEDRSYSYHLIGSLLDYTLFALLLDKRIAKIYWRDDCYHTGGTPSNPSLAGRILNALMVLGNAIAYLESSLLRREPLFASVLHVTARRLRADET